MLSVKRNLQNGLAGYDIPDTDDVHKIEKETSIEFIFHKDLTWTSQAEMENFGLPKILLFMSQQGFLLKRP